MNHAAEIFKAARHPKSFIPLAEADHLLSRPSDSTFAAELIANWANHLFLDRAPDAREEDSTSP